MTIYKETYTKLWGANGKEYLVSTFNTDKVKIRDKYDREYSLDLLGKLMLKFKRHEIVSRRFIIC